MEAINDSVDLSPNIMFSVGDTLTWIKYEKSGWEKIKNLISSKQYQTFIYVQDGDIEIFVINSIS